MTARLVPISRLEMSENGTAVAEVLPAAKRPWAPVFFGDAVQVKQSARAWQGYIGGGKHLRHHLV
jgi:hypothetical protein